MNDSGNRPQPQAIMSSTRSYWRWSKQDFFPEPSFENLTSYKEVGVPDILPTQRPSRVPVNTRGRGCGASGSKRERHEKVPQLNWWDLLWLTFGAVVGSGIFVITGQEAHDHAGPAVVLSYAISGFSALLSVLCYAEFGVEIPVAGGAFSYLRIELGDFIAFVAAGNVLLEAIVGNAGLARSWSSYFGSMIKGNPNFFRFHVKGLAHGFNYLDPLAVAILAITNTIAIVGARQASMVNWISSIVSSGIIVFVLAVGFSHAKASNLSPFSPNGAGGVLQAAAIVFWSYTGFDLVATMAEETKNPTRDIPIGLVGGMSVVTLVYCLMSLALTMMVKYTDIDRDAAYSAAFVNLGIVGSKIVAGRTPQFRAI